MNRGGGVQKGVGERIGRECGRCPIFDINTSAVLNDAGGGPAVGDVHPASEVDPDVVRRAAGGDVESVPEQHRKSV